VEINSIAILVGHHYQTGIWVGTEAEVTRALPPSRECTRGGQLSRSIISSEDGENVVIIFPIFVLLPGGRIQKFLVGSNQDLGGIECAWISTPWEQIESLLDLPLRFEVCKLYQKEIIRKFTEQVKNHEVGFLR
jgi:hypothetical protein